MFIGQWVVYSVLPALYFYTCMLCASDSLSGQTHPTHYTMPVVWIPSCRGNNMLRLLKGLKKFSFLPNDAMWPRSPSGSFRHHIQMPAQLLSSFRQYVSIKDSPSCLLSRLCAYRHVNDSGPAWRLHKNKKLWRGALSFATSLSNPTQQLITFSLHECRSFYFTHRSV